MSFQSLETIAQALVANGKGILAADETVATLTKRFEQLKIQSTPESRRDYRELLCTTAGSAQFISGVIMYDETIRQQTSNGKRMVDILLDQGIIPGIKVDTGAKPLAGCEHETVTEGLDGLRERLKDYHAIGAQFAKWRAVIHITDQLPSRTCVNVNAHALGRYAALCQEQGLVPIVEPEVLMEGTHTIDRCNTVTGEVLHAVFNELYEQRVSLEGMLLKPNMIISGSTCPAQASVTEVADATLRCLLGHVPATVPGIVFLSGGQSDVIATAHLNAINNRAASKPWKISFSYGRALQDPALATWQGNKQNYAAAQQAFHHRAKCNAAASAGKYTATMENEFSGEIARRHRSEHQDD
ncbi:MAG: fructose-bisphosphate aldolase class I [Deltaproteobacteria bacterium]|nr:fructose-bisphosphate aldolase class I [Deltaproteobacteria bacterium]